jgi:hypothetical protein
MRYLRGMETAGTKNVRHGPTWPRYAGERPAKRTISTDVTTAT